MGIISLITISSGLSMDAFAVSVCKGLSLKNYRLKYSIITGLYFGAFQALMPFFGYLLGNSFSNIIVSIDHWIAFILLGLIGANMINEARKKDESVNASFSFISMTPLALATSIDALAVGITFSFLKINIIHAMTITGIITFFLSAFGVKIGQSFGARFKAPAEIAGGAVLILMGIKILFDHLL